MTISLASQLALSIAWQYQNTLDLSTVKDHGVRQLDDALASGTGLDQADLVFHDKRTLSATSSESLDLAGGLTDAFGQSLAFARIKAITIRNLATTAGYHLEVGGAASNAFVNWVGDASDVLRIGPGGVMQLWNPSAAGYAVTAGTGDLLKINNPNGASLEYEIILIGASA